MNSNGKEHKMRKRIYQIVESTNETTLMDRAYNLFMIVVIELSLIPLTIKGTTPFLTGLDYTCAAIFIVDYILRLITADFKFDKPGAVSFIRYPFSFMAIIDLLSILPTFLPVNSSLKLLRLFRMFRVLRVFRVLRYSKNFAIVISVIKKSKDSLIAVGTLAASYILVSALIIFNIEPESFDNFFEAIYWATVSLTTVGYGDIYPVTDVGRVITMISSVFGIAIVALPAGILTAGYMQAVEEEKKSKKA